MPAPKRRGGGAGTDASEQQYVCVKCGWEFEWTSKTTPASVKRHQAENPTHVRFEKVLYTLPRQR